MFEVDDAALERLDFFEHVHLPMGHNRLKIAVEMVASGGDGGSEGILDAWAYTKNRRQLEVIHAELTDEYHHDPRYVLPADRPSDQ